MAISGVLERIESSLDLLTLSEAKVARWILEHPEDVLQLTVRELASQANASQAAVIRLCRTLKIEGYSTLKVLLTADLVRQERPSLLEYPEINPNATFDSQLQMLAHAVESSVLGTFNNLDRSELERVGERLKQAERVLIFGLAASQVVADDLTQKMTRLGYSAVCWHDVHMATISAAVLGPKDMAILISFSGLTREVIEVAAILRRRGVFVAAVTQFRPKNVLAESADVVLHVTATEPIHRAGATTSVIASLLVADVLMLWMANQDSQRALENLQSTEEAVRHHRLNVSSTRRADPAESTTHGIG